MLFLYLLDPVLLSPASKTPVSRRTNPHHSTRLDTADGWLYEGDKASSTWLSWGVSLILSPVERASVAIVELLLGPSDEHNYSWLMRSTGRKHVPSALRGGGSASGSAGLGDEAKGPGAGLEVQVDGDETVFVGVVDDVKVSGSAVGASCGMGSEEGGSLGGDGVESKTLSGSELRGGIMSPTDVNTGEHDGTPEKAARPRRLFLEFYGPVVELFKSMGLRQWTAELLTTLAAQLCPLLTAAPLLRLSARPVDGSETAGGRQCRGMRSLWNQRL